MSRTHLHSVPWATLGRRESAREFFRKIDEQKERFPLFKSTPLLSLVVLCDPQTKPFELKQCLESLKAQAYPRWEAIFIGTSKDERSRKAVEGRGDPRLQWLQAEDGESNAQQKNRGAETARGEWLGFLSTRDILSPTALYHFVLRLQGGDCDLLYANDILLAKDGKRVRHFYSRCAFSWFTLLHFNYIGRFWLVKRERFEGFDEALDGAADQAFLLRLSERTQRFAHLPLYLLYRRGSEKIGRRERLIPFLQTHLNRLGIEAKAKVQEEGVVITPKIAEPEQQLVSAVICFRDRPEWTLRCVRSLVKQVGRVNLEIILVNNRSSEESLARIREGIAGSGVPIEIVNYAGAFNFGNMHNVAMRRHCRGQYLLLLNNDVFLKGKGHLDELVAWAQYAWVGTVGVLLRYDHGGVQHSGLSATFGGEARIARLGNGQKSSRYAEEDREVFGNTFAACLMKRATYDDLGGFRETDLANGFGDVAFNLECLRRGLKNLYLGHIEGIHLESASRGLSYEYWEECSIEREYSDLIQKMLREELGVDLVPRETQSFLRELYQVAMGRLRVSAPWLKPIKHQIRKALNRRAVQDLVNLSEA